MQKRKEASDLINGPIRTKGQKTQEGNFSTRTGLLPGQLMISRGVLDSQFFKGFVAGNP